MTVTPTSVTGNATLVKLTLSELTPIRGSGGTNNSSSSGGHDNSSSSARYSSSSTLPSSTDIPLDEKPLPTPQDVHRIPAPPVPATHPLSLRAGGRTFSFGRRKPQSPSSASPITQPPQVYSHTQEPGIQGRERALTESSFASGSTATPPKLLDTGLGLGSSDLDGFGDMFENFGKRRSTLSVDPAGLGVTTETESPVSWSIRRDTGMVEAHATQESISPAPASRTLTASYFGERSSTTPSPVQVGRSRDVQEAQSSPYSWTSHGSRDGLMGSPGLASAGHAQESPQSRGILQARLPPEPCQHPILTVPPTVRNNKGSRAMGPASGGLALMHRAEIQYHFRTRTQNL